MTDFSTYIADIQEISASELAVREKIFLLKQLLERLCKELTRDEAVQFPNLFSRLVFVAQKHGLPKQLEWQLQNFRVRERQLRKKSDLMPKISEFHTAERAVVNLCLTLQGNDTEEDSAPEETVAALPTDLSADCIRVHVLHINTQKKLLTCAVENAPAAQLTVKLGVAPDNAAFHTSAERFWEGAQLNLIGCTTDKNGHLVPKIIVLEPDYLIDASAVAECFQDYAASPLHYFRNKFEERENRSYLLLGNLANFFLDELVFAENTDDVAFNDAFLRSFKQSPFEYTSCEDIRQDADFREFMEKARMQFQNIGRVIRNDFPQRGVDVRHCTLEPSFFSEKFGFQGRLDLLHAAPETPRMHIVELKSGRLPYPAADSGKIALNHEVQTAVYRLMVQSVFGKDTRNIDAAILYSAGNNAGENLRFAAVYHELEKQIVNTRNLIVANEYALAQGDTARVADMFRSLFRSAETGAPLPDFYVRRIQNFRQTLNQCSELELNYFFRFIRFISRELYLQKIGDADYESPTGVAALWNSDFAERADALDVLFDLSIQSINDSGNGMSIVFARNRAENGIVNFREGEICIVYPRNAHTDTALNTQILKGSIAAISPETVEVRFRYRQRNQLFFRENTHWAIEHDTLDTSYNSMYRGLFAFLNAPQQKRNLLLGLDAPTAEKPKPETRKYPENIIANALAANDYFLIVGPPGTGKTSIFARRLIEEYYTDAEKNILVLAYTNRAVDELCEAIHAAFGRQNAECDAYIRVGTELSCAPPYRNRLLQRVSERAQNRAELRREIERTRIYVSTLASINGRTEIFALKHFHVAIIDEASQILEPQIIGLLPQFDKFVMIGDHNQLATIVLQKPTVSAVTDTELNEMGMTDCRDSLFERLLRRCHAQNWRHAYAQLTHQGRMHEEIAAFPAAFFYGKNLFPALGWQSEPWNLTHASDDIFCQTVANRRTTFFSTEKLHRYTPSNKINETEAEIMVRLVQSLQTVYEENGRGFNAQNVGIIAPYRNQIALIRHKLAEAQIADYEKIMIDTVERFQGSQRDVMLISFCVNKPYQLNFLCNLNHDGTVDRKLNVALTRARQQLFLVGNARMLRQHPIYGTLVEFYRDKVLEVL